MNRADYQRAWYANNREHCRAAKRDYCAARREKINARALTYREASIDIHRARERAQQWKRAGIVNPDGSPYTVVDHDRLYQIQQGRCAICTRHQSELSRALASDHDHTTGHIRGLLCTNCNRMLATVEDQKFVAAATHYLSPKES